MNIKEKIKMFFLKQDPSLPPMEPAVRRKRGEIAPGTKELTDQGYRVPVVDTIRGVIIIVAFLYEIVFDVYTYGFFQSTGFASFCAGIMTGETLKYWVFGFKCLFVAISGISTNYTKNHWKRVIILGCCAVIISIGSAIFFGIKNMVWFGYLHFLTLAWAIYGLINTKARKLYNKVGLAPWLLLFVVTYILLAYINPPRLMIGSFEVPYYFIGITPIGYTTTELYGLIPWIFMFFFGATFGKYMKEGLVGENNYKFFIPGIDIIGRNGLFIYLLHFPVVYGVLLLINSII